MSMDLTPRKNGKNGKSYFQDIERPIMIGVAGGTSSGKTSVCQRVIELLGNTSVDIDERRICIISMDCFYKDLSSEDREKAENGTYNFDHPDAFDFDFMHETLQRIIRHDSQVTIPVYDHANYCRTGETTPVHPGDVVLIEGILIFYQADIREMFHIKLFVDTDPDTRLSRRVLRDMNEMNRSLEQILSQYTQYVKPAFEEFCLPTKKYADIIIPRGADNQVAIDLIGQHILEFIRPKRAHKKRVRVNSESLSTNVRPH